MTTILLHVILATLVLFAHAIPCRGQAAEAPQPVKRFTSSLKTAEIDILRFELQRPYLGYEGPNFTRLNQEPSANAEYLVEAQLYAQEAAATAKFELVDAAGRFIETLRLFKPNNSINDGDFFGFIKVPRRPFRVAVSGRGVDGQSYRSVYKRLFRPTTRPPAAPILPRRLRPAEAKRIATLLIALEKQAIAEMKQKRFKSPDATIVMPRFEVSNVTYESFRSEKGNTLGLRLRYDIRFAEDGDYAHDLHVFPFYDDEDKRGLIDLHVLNEQIEPKPGPPSYATPSIHVDLNTLVSDGSEAWFRGGVVYHFTVDLIPNFLWQHPTSKTFCITNSAVQSSRFWEAIKRDSTPVKYRIFINRVGYGGETNPFHPPKTYYEAFLNEGAINCPPH